MNCCSCCNSIRRICSFSAISKGNTPTGPGPGLAKKQKLDKVQQKGKQDSGKIQGDIEGKEAKSAGRKTLTRSATKIMKDPFVETFGQTLFIKSK